MPISGSDHFRIETAEGTRIDVDQDGNIIEAHVGDRARGLNGQDLRVCTRAVDAVPTNAEGYAEAGAGEVPVLQIVVSNHGINERGLPGVRLATVTGLIIETDAYGRYNIPDVDAGSSIRGQNFILKVDKASLPDGARFTTENPYVLRIVNTALNKINFGVQIDHRKTDQYAAGNILCNSGTPEEAQALAAIEVNLGSVFFDTNSAQVREDQEGICLLYTSDAADE